MKPPLRIDIFSDVACPWCYIGEARLKTALTESGVTAEIHWQSFQLQPGLPPEGVAWRPFAERKFGGWDSALKMFEQLSALGRAEGLNFHFTDIAKANNTEDAHRLILYAQDRGQGEAAAHALYKAYFEDAQDLNDSAVLIGLAETLGLNAEDVRVYLQSDENKDKVSASQTRANELGVSGVPFYVFNKQLGLSGAQPTETFMRALTYDFSEEPSLS